MCCTPKVEVVMGDNKDVSAHPGVRTNTGIREPRLIAGKG
jgi:hypothetical protein